MADRIQGGIGLVLLSGLLAAACSSAAPGASRRDDPGTAATTLEAAASCTPGTIVTVAGMGEPGSSGDGGPATEARLNWPFYVTFDADGNLYVAEELGHRVRRVDPDGVITTVAGTGEAGYSGDGGLATEARLNGPSGLAAGPDGNLYIVDGLNHVIRRVDPAGVIATVAGSGKQGHSGDGGPAAQAELFNPVGLTIDGDGSLFVSEEGNNTVRKIDPDGVITTVAGTGQAGYSGDGGPASDARLYWPFDVELDPAGNLYIVEVRNHIVRRVDTDGVISTVAGTGERGVAEVGGPVASGELNLPAGIDFGAEGTLYIADHANHRVLRVQPDGGITRVAGTGEGGFSGDGGPATEAQLFNPVDVELDAGGNLYITDRDNHRVRKVCA